MTSCHGCHPGVWLDEEKDEDALRHQSPASQFDSFQSKVWPRTFTVQEDSSHVTCVLSNINTCKADP